jgi:hypothetical protein
LRSNDFLSPDIVAAQCVRAPGLGRPRWSGPERRGDMIAATG